MRVILHKQCAKQLRKVPRKVQDQFLQRVELYLQDPKSPVLHVHTLQGKKRIFQSLNVSGDYRALFIQKGKTITFYKIGTHSELYS